MARPTRQQIRRAFSSAVWALALEVDVLAESYEPDELDPVLTHALRALPADQATALRDDATTRRAVLAHALFARHSVDEQHTALVRSRRQLARDSALVDCTQRRALHAWRVQRDADDALVVSVADGSNGHQCTELFALAMLDGQDHVQVGDLLVGWCVELREAAALIGLCRVGPDSPDAGLEAARRAWLSSLVAGELW